MPTIVLNETPSTDDEEAPLAHEPWAPYPGPQTAAYACDADVIGYGGAGGGGKTDLILGKAFTKHHRSMLFRRQKADELRNMIERSRDIAPEGARLNENLLIWRRLPDNATVGFGGLEQANDWKHYRGHGYDFFGFDEATEFLETQVRSLMGWNRTTRAGQHCQTILTFNPPTSAEGEWIIRFFAPWIDPEHPNPAEPGEHRYFAMVGNQEREVDGPEPFDYTDPDTGRTETIIPKSRTFYPAKVQDNPALIAQGYVATLQGLPEPLRSQVLYGDFTVGIEDDQWQTIPTMWVRVAQERWRNRGGISPVPLASLGVDVARGGRDFTIFAPKRGAAWVDTLITYPGVATPDGPDVAAKVFGYLIEQNARTALIVIDGIGVGASPADFLKQIPDLNIYVAIGSEKALAFDENGRQRFANTRTWFWWHVRELLDPKNGVNLCLPDDAKLRADLCAPRWKPLANGVIALETKEDLVKRLGRSPDRGDAVVLALAPVAGVNRDAVRPIHVDRAPQLSPWRQDRWRSFEVGG